MSHGRAFFEAKARVDMWQYPVGLRVVAQGAAAEGFDVGEVDFGPYGGAGVGEFLAGPDDLGLGETRR